jgi:hypothetical protein
MTPKEKRDAAIDAFAAAMKASLDWAAEHGRTGWDDEAVYSLDDCRSDMADDALNIDLLQEDSKTVDIANRCMFLWYRAEKPVLAVKSLAALLLAARETLQAIQDIHKALGAPGDYGYETKEGKALLRLYRSTTGLVEQVVEESEVSNAQRSEHPPTGDNHANPTHP